DDVVRSVADAFRTRTYKEWDALFAREGLPVAGVRRVSEVVDDPHVAARALLPTVDVPGVGPLHVIAHPAKHSVSEIENPARAPEKGQDTEAILRSLEYTDAEIEDLARQGVISR
ncbi:MAG: CoA transferase, partial [Methanobacteriota archaeon]